MSSLKMLSSSHCSQILLNNVKYHNVITEPIKRDSPIPIRNSLGPLNFIHFTECDVIWQQKQHCLSIIIMAVYPFLQAYEYLQREKIAYSKISQMKPTFLKVLKFSLEKLNSCSTPGNLE